MKKLIYILFFVVLGQASFAQQLPLYSQYLYNKFLINPAHAGSDGFTSFNVTAREQWVGYSRAPRTYSVSWQTRLLKQKYKLKQNIFNRTIYKPKTDGRVGLGGYIFSDKNALVQRTGFQMTYSHHIWLDDYQQLSMGLAFTGYHYKINANENSFHDPWEPWLNDNLRKGVFIPDVDFGIYLLNPRYDIGFSAQQLLGAYAKIRLGDYAYRNYRMDRHFYLFGSYTFYSGVRTELEPSVLLKMSEQLRPQADFGLTFCYDQSIWAGITYRTGGALITNFRIKYVNSRVNMTTMFFGYSYDFTLNEIQRATYGTHEFTLAIKLGDTDRRFRWIDRYGPVRLRTRPAKL
ncbi:MAG: type IX secretion system membrane protein PorP/SprF [Bacteroidales bacterium]|nr:type IX secretion system membrane protein PorP/SprF [Bacteroidales bacterium]